MASTSGGALPDPAGGTPVEVRRGSPADARRAAELHAGQIAEGFLSQLGPAFLERLYRRIARTDSSFLLVAAEGDRVVGFLAGSCDVGGLYRRFLVRDGVAAALGAWRNLLRAWPRALETLRHGGSDEVAAGGAELLSVAVDPAARGRGVGGALVAAFVAELGRRGVGSGHVVVAADNASAISLYERGGFVRSRTFELHPGTVSLVLTWTAP